jgi:hypothetical protein
VALPSALRSEVAGTCYSCLAAWYDLAAAAVILKSAGNVRIMLLLLLMFYRTDASCAGVILCRQGRGAPDLPHCGPGCRHCCCCCCCCWGLSLLAVSILRVDVLVSFSAGKAVVHLFYPTAVSAAAAAAAAAAAGGSLNCCFVCWHHSLQARQRCT